MPANKYQIELEIQSINKIQSLLETMPPFCRAYFNERRTNTTVLTRLGYARDLKLFFDWICETGSNMPDNPVDMTLKNFAEIEAVDIEDFVTYLQSDINRANSNFAVARKLACLKSFWNYFCKRDGKLVNPLFVVSMPKLHNVEIIRLESNEVSHLMDVLEAPKEHFSAHQYLYIAKTQARDTAIIALLLGTGLRVSECVGIDYSDLHLEESKISVRRKGGDAGIVPLTDEVKNYLEPYLGEKAEWKEDDPLFVSTQGKRISTNTILVMLRKYVQAAGINKKITPHKLRKTFGTQLYRETRDIYLVASALGHKEVATTVKHYVAQTEEDLLKARDNIHIRKQKGEKP